MNYAVQFEVPPFIEGNEDYRMMVVERYKKDMSCRLGEMIAGIVGFNEIDPVNKKHVLEVIAFSYKDWSEFKQELKSYITTASQLGLSTFNLIQVGNMIQKLETIGQSKTGIGNETS